MKKIIAFNILCFVVVSSLLSVAYADNTVDIKKNASTNTDTCTTRYTYSHVEKNLYDKGALAYWLFTPEVSRPTSAPVIIFLHGWMGMDPYAYGGWIEHLVKKGNIVIYPIFQTSKEDTPEEMLSAALDAIKNALNRLQKNSPVTPLLNNIAIVGHSFGGGLTTQVAARMKAKGLPEPKAIMPVQPGWRGSDSMPTEKLDQIPSSTLMLVIIGADDQFKDTRQDKTIWSRTKQIPTNLKRHVTLQSDKHRNPPLLADHSSPLAPLEAYRATPLTNKQKRRRKFINWITKMRDGEIDNLDYCGYWRLFDALYENAFKNEPSITKVIDSAGDNFMGRWPDGKSIKEKLIHTAP